MAEIASVEPHWHPVRGHLKALDGVRGLAILMVICLHAFESNYEASGLFARLIGEFFYYGLFGVDLFFVLSGFLITGILFDSLHDHGYFRKFYVRRALRIFPLYYGVLIVVLLLTHPLHLHWGGMGWLLLFYLQNLRPAAISVFSPGAGIGLYHFWSLAVEEQFYLVWPAIVFFVRDKRTLLIVTVAGSVGALALRVGILAFGGEWGLAIHVTTICRADSLLLGGTLAMLYRSRMWPRVLRFAPWGFGGAAVLILASVGPFKALLAAHPAVDLFWRDGVRYSVLAFGFACLIAWSLRSQSLCARVFHMGGLRFLGKYSYGIYVLHVLVLSVLSLPLRAFLLQLTHSKMIAVAGAGICSLAVGIVAAYVSFNLYEKPFLRLKHLFDYQRPSLNHSSPEEKLVSR